METLNSLRPRELQVAGMVAWGYSVKEIADRLCISSLTVRTHIKNIYRTTNCSKATDIARLYILEHGFTVPMFNIPTPQKNIWSRFSEAIISRLQSWRRTFLFNQLHKILIR